MSSTDFATRQPTDQEIVPGDDARADEVASNSAEECRTHKDAVRVALLGDGVRLTTPSSQARAVIDVACRLADEYSQRVLVVDPSTEATVSLPLMRATLLSEACGMVRAPGRRVLLGRMNALCANSSIGHAAVEHSPLHSPDWKHTKGQPNYEAKYVYPVDAYLSPDDGSEAHATDEKRGTIHLVAAGRRAWLAEANARRNARFDVDLFVKEMLDGLVSRYAFDTILIYVPMTSANMTDDKTCAGLASQRSIRGALYRTCTHSRPIESIVPLDKPFPSRCPDVDIMTKTIGGVVDEYLTEHSSISFGRHSFSALPQCITAEYTQLGVDDVTNALEDRNKSTAEVAKDIYALVPGPSRESEEVTP